MSFNDRVKEIKLLTPSERLAGYLLARAKLAVFGARVRKNGRQDHTWTKKEIDEWDAICNELYWWRYALTEQERQLLSKIENIITSITCADIERYLLLM